jgi:DNA-binding response OmpR family regulator
VGADDDLVKPADLPALMERIREVLAQPVRGARPA